MNILIVEDEPNTARDLRDSIIEIDKNIVILDILDTIENSVDYLSSQKQPDLIFMDIQLADGLCFEIFKKVEISSPIIFTTAYDEFALKAFAVNSLDYILKPFDKNKLEIALNKFLKVSQHYSKSKDYGNIFPITDESAKNMFLIRTANKYQPIVSKDIALFTVENNITYIVNYQGKKYATNKVLEQIDKLVDEKMFFRANRQFLVNFESISDIQNIANRKLKIKLKVPGKENIIISKAKSSKFLKWIAAH